MKYLQYIVFLLLFIPHQLRAENIIFDIFGVLVDVPVCQKIKHIGVADALGYMFCEGKNIFKIKAKYLSTLAEIPVEEEKLARCIYSHDTTAQGDIMPNLMITWQAGETCYDDALEKVQSHLATRESGYYGKRLLTNISNMTFDLPTRSRIYRLKRTGVALLKKLASEKDQWGQRRHRLFILSNMDHEMMNFLRATYPKVFSLFDDVVYSAATKSLKPHPHIYKTLLTRNHLDPSKCLVFDDQQENIDTAIALGMKGLRFHRHIDLHKALRVARLISGPAY
ncbi:MAG TPA: HAD family hydrolase [Myxococcota bacterium]|nr:HAD family hydrolase [Myxococcota bacterium]